MSKFKATNLSMERLFGLLFFHIQDTRYNEMSILMNIASHNTIVDNMKKIRKPMTSEFNNHKQKKDFLWILVWIDEKNIKNSF